MKKIFIINTPNNELTNQLWNYVSIYAYARERGYTALNPSFFEYGEYFRMRAAPALAFRLAFFLPFRNYTKRKTALRRRIWRKLYAWYSALFEVLYGSNLIRSGLEKTYYLPPSVPPTAELRTLEEKGVDIYFDGWRFRNPKGLEQHRDTIKEYFRPRADIEDKVATQVKTLRKKYSRLIGVHIRQGDYATWRGGAYFLDQRRVREVIEEYVVRLLPGVDARDVGFVICSDGPIEKEIFAGCNTFVSQENAVHDLFLLSSTDAILGSNSTFGAFASYYGNIPFIVMKKEEMDWDYYADKKKYFENKYCTFVHY